MSLKTKSIIVIVAIAAMSAGFWLSLMWHGHSEKTAGQSEEKALAEARNRHSPIQGMMISPARNIVVPALTKDNGELFTPDDLTGQWHFLFFGYTSCPDVCPVTMGVLAQAKKTATANKQSFPEVVFISVDPQRDKVKTLGEYVQYFDKDFIGVTGDENLIKALALQLSVVYMKMPAESDSADYLIDHSAALLLLDPKGRLVAFFNPPHEPKTIVKDFQTVVNRSNEL